MVRRCNRQDGMALSAAIARAWEVAKAAGAQAVLDAAFGCEPVILMYHRFAMQPTARRISAAQFDWQMSYIARRCNVVKWTDLIAGLRNGVAWRRNTVAISIDDGYSDLYDVAFPILKKYGLPATAFITSGFANGAFWHWADQLHFVLANCKDRELRVETGSGAVDLRLDEPRAQWCSWSRVADLCHELPDDMQRDFIDRVSRAAKVVVPEQPPPEYRPASWDQLREMATARVSMGAHTVTHRRLPRLSDEDLVTEIEGGKTALENELQVEVTSFAYPFGTPVDYDARVIDVVRRAGFQSGCVAYFDQHLYKDLYALRRFGVGADSWDFMKIVDGLKRARSLNTRFFQGSVFRQ